MTVSEELALSYYKPVADLRDGHTVQLVQHKETKQFFVKKKLSIYSLEVYRGLQADPVPNIPRIALAVEDEDGLTVIEEYIHGCTLQELLEQDGPMSEAQAVGYALQLCRIVANLHHREPAIIHRDIKPSNVMVSADGVIKLLDMNAAKYATPDRARDTVLLGTAGFAAPEQYGFAPSGVQSDLFAIGVLINVLTTGKMPSAQMAAGKLRPIIKKCMEIDPSNRYASVDALMLALKRVYANTLPRAEDGALPSWRRFLPPGFRSDSVSHMVIAVLGYALLLFAGMCMEVESATPLVLALNRGAFLLMGLAVVFFSADYCGIHTHLPLARSKCVVVRFLGILLYDLILVLGLLIILILVEQGL